MSFHFVVVIAPFIDIEYLILGQKLNLVFKYLAFKEFYQRLKKRFHLVSLQNQT